MGGSEEGRERAWNYVNMHKVEVEEGMEQSFQTMQVGEPTSLGFLKPRVQEKLGKMLMRKTIFLFLIIEWMGILQSLCVQVEMRKVQELNLWGNMVHKKVWEVRGLVDWLRGKEQECARMARLMEQVEESKVAQ